MFGKQELATRAAVENELLDYKVKLVQAIFPKTTVSKEGQTGGSLHTRTDVWS